MPAPDNTPKLIASRFKACGTGIGELELVHDTLLDAPGLLRRVPNGNIAPKKESLIARIRQLRGWRHDSALAVHDLCVDGNDLLVVYDAPESIVPIQGPFHYRIVLQTMPAFLNACAALHAHGLQTGALGRNDVVESKDGSWLLIPPIELESTEDDLVEIGRLLCETLAGTREPRSRHLNDRPEMLVDGRPIPHMVDEAIASLLHPDPAARPPGLLDVAERLQTAATMSASSATSLPPTASKEPVRAKTQVERPRREPIPWGWAFLGLVIIAVATMIYTLRPEPPKAPPQHSPAASAPSPEIIKAPIEIPVVPDPPPAETEKPPPPKIDPALKSAAQSAMENMLAAVAQAEAVNAPDWAAEQWDELKETISKADESHTNEAYKESKVGYDAARDAAQKIYDNRQEAIPGLLQRGNTALAAGDKTAATKAFATALAIDPTHLEAGNGLKRARVLDQVNANLARGAELEAQHLFAGARIAYAAALNLDPLAPGAKEAVRRLDLAIADEAYLSAIKSAREKIAAGELEEAANLVQKALDLRPADPDATALNGEIQRLKRKRQAREIIEKAEVAESAEKWQEANTRYQEALNLDPAATDATAGVQRVAKRHELTTRIQTYVTDPNMLLDANLRRNAKLLIEEVRAIDEKQTPKLHALANQLDKKLDELNRPLAVTIESDNATSITILKTKRLGTLTRKSLELPPGRYVAHGRRLGYQDVRIPFELKPGITAPMISVVCTTPIQ